jgi:hypothetical protein
VVSSWKQLQNEQNHDLLQWIQHTTRDLNLNQFRKSIPWCDLMPYFGGPDRLLIGPSGKNF